MKRFLYLLGYYDLSEIKTELNTLISSLVHVVDLREEVNSILYIYEGHDDLNFEEIILNMLSDTLYDLVLYQSHQFDLLDKLLNHFEFVKKHITHVPKQDGPFINDRKLLKSIMYLQKPTLRENFLGKYAKDNLMLETLKIYFDSDQNMTKAAKDLYIHRNTLIQRLDKFMQETGFDIRKFQDAVVIYQII